MSFLPIQFENFLRKILSKIWAFLFLGIGFGMMVAILDYYPMDTSWNVAGININNVTGDWGAFSASILMQFFGIFGVLIPTLCIVWGIKIYHKRHITIPVLKLFFYTLGIIFLCGSFSVLQWQINSRMSVHGISGYILWYNFLQHFDVVGYLIAVFLFFCGVILVIFGLSVSRIEWGLAAEQIKLYSVFSKNLLRYSFEKIQNGFAILNIFKPQREMDDEPVFDYSTTQNTPKSPPSAVGRSGHNSSSNQSESSKSINPLENGDNAVAPKGTQVPVMSGEEFQLPTIKLLYQAPKEKIVGLSEKEKSENKAALERILQDFKIRGKIIGVRVGPVVITYELELAPGVKGSRVEGLADDIARNMETESTRIISIPQRGVIGIEIPNTSRQVVNYKEILSSKDFSNTEALLPLALGVDVDGKMSIKDLASMPHLLIAGTTGSGKSVGLNAMVISLLYKHTPETLRIIMIDPKMLEFEKYHHIPHLLSPVVTDPKKAVVALKWAVREMNDRYAKMAKAGVRNITSFNEKMEQLCRSGEVLTETVTVGFDENNSPIFEDRIIDTSKLPFIVVIVDELADLMLEAGKDIEGSIQSLAQKARASGIHLIVATQRPSVDVITGTIKANFPARIAYMVTSKIDSRTILNEQGAEQLLGWGDMLCTLGSRPQRYHAPFVRDEEVEQVCNWLRAQQEPEYQDSVVNENLHTGAGAGSGDGDAAESGAGGGSKDDIQYDEAVALVANTGKVSISFVQRSLRIGYNRAAIIVERMEAEGVVSAASHSGKREVLIEKR